jgi:hypothetical protein
VCEALRRFDALFWRCIRLAPSSDHAGSARVHLSRQEQMPTKTDRASVQHNPQGKICSAFNDIAIMARAANSY